MSIYEDTFTKLKQEFPDLTIKRKADSSLMKVMGFLFRLVTFFQVNNFMKNYATTIGYTIYVPTSWDVRGEESKTVLLRHEAVHMRQKKLLGSFKMFLLYTFYIFPVGLAVGRAKLEWEAYAEELHAIAEIYGIEMAKKQKKFIVEQFTTAAYLWMFPFPKTVSTWFDTEIKSIEQKL